MQTQKNREKKIENEIGRNAERKKLSKKSRERKDTFMIYNKRKEGTRQTRNQKVTKSNEGKE